MREKIIKRLAAFEKENSVRILLAVESGSRGWGFASEDSDYDVRFVFVHPFGRYLDLTKPKTDCEWTEGKCDYAGFDIYKFYDLLFKSNMNIIDWLMQDVIYIDRLQNKAQLKSIVSEYFNKRTYAAHNFGLCTKNYTKYFASRVIDEPTVKRFVYCIRALLSAKYCMEHSALAPLKFDDLLKATLKEPELSEMREMVELKKRTKERECYNNVKWREFIERNMRQPLTADNSDSETRNEFERQLNRHLHLQL